MPRLYGQSQIPTVAALELVQKYHPVYWKVLGQALEDRVFVSALRQNGTTLLGRLYLPEVDGTWRDGWLEAFLRRVMGDPIGMAEWYAQKIRYSTNFDLVDHWETPNEPFGQMHAEANPNLTAAYDRFMAVLTNILLRNGKKAVVGNMGSGAWAGRTYPLETLPHAPPLTAYRLNFRELFNNTAMLNPVWGQHEYGWPEILSQAETRVTYPVRHALAHTRIDWPGAIWITEVAVTKAVDGQGPDVGYFSEHDDPLPFATMLQNYNNVMEADAAFVFLTGAAQDWRERGFEATHVLELAYEGIRGKGRPLSSGDSAQARVKRAIRLGKV